MAACHAARRVKRDGQAGDGWTLTGTAHYVLDGDVADVLIVAASLPEGGIALFEVAPDRPGVERQAAIGVDQTRRLATIGLATGAGPPLAGSAAAPVAGALALTRARDLGCVALSAEQVGAAARALELTVGYAKQRIQFGRPIASFQAVQHRLAELHALAGRRRAATSSPRTWARRAWSRRPRAVLRCRARPGCRTAPGRTAAAGLPRTPLARAPRR